MEEKITQGPELRVRDNNLEMVESVVIVDGPGGPALLHIQEHNRAMAMLWLIKEVREVAGSDATGESVAQLVEIAANAIWAGDLRRPYIVTT
jgi:hypothetical protein